MYGTIRAARTTVAFECGSRLFEKTEKDSRLTSKAILPDAIGADNFDSTSLDDRLPVLSIKVESLRSPGGLLTTTWHDDPFLGFCVVKEMGESALCWLDGSRDRRPLLRGGSYIISAGAITHGYYPQGSSVRMLAAFIDPGRLSDIASDIGGSSAILRRLIEEPDGETGLLASPAEMEAQRIASQIDGNPYVGGLRSLYLESKALELCAVLLAAHCEEEQRTKVLGLDARRMEEVRELIDLRLADPPSLKETAAIFGISVSKLKRDFKLVTGQGVHEYAIGRRLESARAIIREGSARIKEVSFTAGYKSASQFARHTNAALGACRPRSRETIPW